MANEARQLTPDPDCPFCMGGGLDAMESGPCDCVTVAPSYCVWVVVKPGDEATNAVRYATWEEADAAGRELLSRWFLPERYEVRGTDDPVNYRFDFDRNRPVSLG